jgi:phosphoglycolate phosphatase
MHNRPSPASKRVCFFDIDGTLLNSGGAGQHAMEQALEEAFGVRGPYHNIPAAGRTDRAITADLFRHHGIEVSEENWNRFLECYLSHLPQSLTVRDGRVLPGILQLLDAMSRRDDFALGLLTGNLRVGAEVKLRHYSIDHHFRFGGYGDRHHDRDDVARWALTEACTFLQCDVAAHTAWVIGDTPSDIRCARAIGARVIAVATGVYAASDLHGERPDYLFESLSDVDRVLGILAS